jgi:hypothetical protein
MDSEELHNLYSFSHFIAVINQDKRVGCVENPE